MSEKSFRQRVLTAGGWAILGNLVGQLIRFGSNLILTRLLMPDAFGLMAIITVVMFGLSMLSDTGTTQALVRSPRGLEPVFRATAWSVQLVRGAFLGVLCILVASGLLVAANLGWLPAGTTYAHPDLPWLLYAYSICPLIQGAASTKLALAQRALQIKESVLCSMWSQILALPFTLLMAWSLQSVWALLLGSLLAALLQTALSHRLIRGEPDRLGWDRDSLQELASFGRWVLVASAVGFMASNGDRLLLSGLISAAQLGHYAIAFLIVSVVQMVFSLVLGSVVFPAISEVARTRPADLERTYIKFQRFADLVLVGAGAALAIAGPALVRLVYDDRYVDTGWMVSVLAMGLAGMRFQVLEQCYLALGKPSWMSLSNVLRVCALLLLVPLGHRHGGMWGAVVGVAVSQYAGWGVAFYFRYSQRFSVWRAEAWLPLALVGGLAAGGILAFTIQYCSVLLGRVVE